MGLFKWLAVATIFLASPIAMFGCQSLGTADVAPGWISIFDGETLSGWTPKISGEELGEDRRETFRVRGGVLSVDYENYDAFDNEFGHLFYDAKLSDYRLKLEYRFTGEQMSGGPAWAHLNSGVMLHSQDPQTMTKDQFFPVSVEAQFLAAFDAVPERTTGNVCTPGTHVGIGGALVKEHCINSAAKGPRVNEWVQFEADVSSGEMVRFYVNGELAFELTSPELDTEDKDTQQIMEASTALSAGYIALQSESHPIEFRNIYLMDRSRK